MTLVVDTNVLMSALIADSTTRELLRDVNRRIVAPARLENELQKYDDLIQEKSGLAESEVALLRERLFEYVEFVPDRKLRKHRPEAREALADTDPDDVIFLATALAVDGTIWSDDGDFLEQELVPVLDTADVVDELGEESGG